MINKLTLSGLLLFSTIFVAPQAIAQDEGDNDTRIEKYEDLTETDLDSAQSEMDDMDSMDDMESEDGIIESETRTEEVLEQVQSNDSDVNYDVRRTEAFNLVSSAYRGDFEDQGVNSYGVLITNYETGDLTAEDLIQAAVDAGELSPAALEDDGYVRAVDAQLDALTNS